MTDPQWLPWGSWGPGGDAGGGDDRKDPARVFCPEEVDQSDLPRFRLRASICAVNSVINCASGSNRPAALSAPLPQLLRHDPHLGLDRGGSIQAQIFAVPRGDQLHT